MSFKEGVPVMSIWGETERQTQGGHSLGAFYLSAAVGITWDFPRGDGGGSWGEEHLGSNTNCCPHNPDKDRRNKAAR